MASGLDVAALLGDIREALLSPETTAEAASAAEVDEEGGVAALVSERRSALASLLLLSTSPRPAQLRAIVDARLIDPLLRTALALPAGHHSEGSGGGGAAAEAPPPAAEAAPAPLDAAAAAAAAAAASAADEEAGLLRAAALSVLANLAREHSCARALIFQGALPALVGCALGAVGSLGAGSAGYAPGTKVLAPFLRASDGRWTTVAYPALVLEVEACDGDGSGDDDDDDGGARRALQRRQVRTELCAPSAAPQPRYRLLYADGDIAGGVPLRRVAQALDDLAGADGQLDGGVAASGLGSGPAACAMLLSQARIARLLAAQPVEVALLLAHESHALPAGGGARAASASASASTSAAASSSAAAAASAGSGADRAVTADAPLPLMHHSDLVTVGMPGKPRPARSALWSAAECAHARAVAGGAAFAQRVATAALASMLPPLPLGSAERRTFVNSGALEVLLALAQEAHGAAPLRAIEEAAAAEAAAAAAAKRAAAAEKRQRRRAAADAVAARRGGKRAPLKRQAKLTAAEEAMRLELGMSEAEFREELRQEAEQIAREEEEFARERAAVAGEGTAAAEVAGMEVAGVAGGEDDNPQAGQQQAEKAAAAAAEKAAGRRPTAPDVALLGACSLDVLRRVAPPTGADGVGGEGAGILCALARRTLAALPLETRRCDLSSLQLARTQRERGGGDVSFVAGDALASGAAGLPLEALLRPRGVVWWRSGAAAEALAREVQREEDGARACAAQAAEAQRLARDRTVPLEGRLGAASTWPPGAAAAAAALADEDREVAAAAAAAAAAAGAVEGKRAAPLAVALPADPASLRARLHWRGTELAVIRAQRGAEAAICGAVLATPGGADFGAWRHAHPAAAERRRATAEAAEARRCGAKQRRALAEACEAERAAMEWDEATQLRLEYVLHPAESEMQRKNRLRREAGQRVTLRVRKAAKASAAEERKRLLWKSQLAAAEAVAEADDAELAAAAARNVAIVQADAERVERESAGGAIEQAEAEHLHAIGELAAERKLEQATREELLQEDERSRQLRLPEREAREQAQHEAHDKKRSDAAARKAKRKAKRDKQAAKEAKADAKQQAAEAAEAAAAELAHKRQAAAASKTAMEVRLGAIAAKKAADKPPLPKRPPDVERYVPREILCKVERFYEKDDGEGGIVLENNMTGERWHVGAGDGGKNVYENRATGEVSDEPPRPRTQQEREEEEKKEAAAAEAVAAAAAAEAATASASAAADGGSEGAQKGPAPETDAAAATDGVTALPSGWEARDDGQGNTYYENSSGETTWDRPGEGAPA